MRNLQLVWILLLCVCMSAFSQNFKYGKVSKEELEENVFPKDSSVNAAYLYKYRRTYFEYDAEKGFLHRTRVHERIKIYNKEGFNFATKTIGLYIGRRGGEEEQISGIKGSTYSLKGGKPVFKKLTKGAIFKKNINKFTNEVKFTMPDIKPGCVIEYKYEITSPFWSNIDEFVFQHSIPVKKLNARFEVPEYYNFKLNTKGFLMVKPEKDSKSSTLAYKYAIPITENALNDPIQHYSTGEVDYTTDIFEYDLDNVPALKQEPYTNNIRNYRSSVKYELSSVNMPDSPIKYYTRTWEDVTKTIYKRSSFGGELSKTAYYQNDIKELIKAENNSAKKVALIFNFVKSHMKWNGFYSIYSNGVKNAYKSKLGNSADINLMLTSMLRYAGVNANPVLVSTRNHGIPLFPTKEGFNYVVTWVKLPDGATLLLDATAKLSAPNVLPFRTLNWKGRIVAENGGSSFINLYPKAVSKSITNIMLNIDENGAVRGGCRNTRTNHRALSFRKKYRSKGKDNYVEALEHTYNDMEVTDYEVTNMMKLSKPVLESYKFNLEGQADVIGDKLYFSPMFHLREIENPFKLEKREFPIDFGYPLLKQYRASITIPEAYKVEHVPEPTSFALPDNLGKFSYKVSTSGKNIQVVISQQINASIVSPLYYSALKTYCDMYLKKEAEQIVLTKL